MAAAIVADELRRQPEVSVDFGNPAELHLLILGCHEKDTGSVNDNLLQNLGIGGSFSSVMKLIIADTFSISRHTPGILLLPLLPRQKHRRLIPRDRFYPFLQSGLARIRRRDVLLRLLPDRLQ